MATAEQQHPKGILKNSSSFEHSHGSNESKKERGMKWDEMNILSTYHPADKDYGHMKITDPPTPYNYDKLEDEDEELDPDRLATKLQGMKQTKMSPRPGGGESDDSEEEEGLTEEAQEHKNQFEQKRKIHYNEFQAVKLARKLMEEDDEEDEEDSATPSSTSDAPVDCTAQTTSTSAQSTADTTSERQQ